mmetsp:Transcript_1169/g.2608  ORF Transcript_1169/g.2608 Transcript_1169/m.2608 type:complete len:209 (+) Transcript_1169:1061-1687(+)
MLFALHLGICQKLLVHQQAGLGIFKVLLGASFGCVGFGLLLLLRDDGLFGCFDLCHFRRLETGEGLCTSGFFSPCLVEIGGHSVLHGGKHANHFSCGRGLRSINIQACGSRCQQDLAPSRSQAHLLSVVLALKPSNQVQRLLLNVAGCRKEGCRFGLQMVQRCVNASQRLLDLFLFLFKGLLLLLPLSFCCAQGVFTGGQVSFMAADL